MTYCQYCGVELPEGAIHCPECGAKVESVEKRFCASCGQQIRSIDTVCPYCNAEIPKKKRPEIPVNSSGKEIRSEKSTIIGMILSFFITGVGTIYAGYEKEGVILLVIMIVCAFAEFASMLFLPDLMFVIAIISFVVWIYGIYDAYKKCEDSNRLWYAYEDSLNS